MLGAEIWKVRAKRAAALRERANDLRIELKNRPHLAASLLAVIEELERKADRLEGKRPDQPPASEIGPSTEADSTCDCES